MKYVGEARAKYNPAAPLIGITPMGPINGTPTMHTLSHVHAAGGDGGGAVHEFVGDDVMKMGNWKRRWQLDPADRTWRNVPGGGGADGGAGGATGTDASREAKRARRTLLSVGTMVEWEENAHVCAGQKVPERERKPFNAVGLDPNHSHFILVENEEYKVGPSGFGSEQGVRAAFEKCLADNSYFRRSPTAKEHPFSVFKPAPDLLDSEAADDVPLVCVCVQGGPGTVGTVLNAVMQDIPALLVRGSGKASDLLSDAVLLKRIAHVAENFEQQQLWALLSALNVTSAAAPSAAGERAATHYDYEAQVLTLRAWAAAPDEARDQPVERLLRTVYGFGVGVKREACFKLLVDALLAANSGKCWVFDLNNADGDDFNGALLKCLLNGMSGVADSMNPRTQMLHCQREVALLAGASGAEAQGALKSAQERLALLADPAVVKELEAQHAKVREDTCWKKLKYTMLWGRDDILPTLLDEMVVDFPAEARAKLLQQALIYTLQRNKVLALQTLLSYSAQVLDFDVGAQYCFMKHEEDITVDMSSSSTHLEQGAQGIVFPAGAISRRALVELLAPHGWQDEEAEQLYDKLAQGLAGGDAAVIDKEYLLGFNPCGLIKTFHEMDHGKDNCLDQGELEVCLCMCVCARAHALSLLSSPSLPPLRSRGPAPRLSCMHAIHTGRPALHRHDQGRNSDALRVH